MDSDPGFGVASEVIRIVVEPNTFMIIGGTALGEYTQRLTILREADEWQLIGLQKVLICDRTRRCLSFAPVEKTVTYILLFESASQGSEFVESEYTRDFKSTKHIIPNFATYYTIHTENGSDDRFPDITLSVALIAATKGGTASNSRDDKLNSHPGMNPDEPEPILEPFRPGFGHFF
ncbi:hypothetical protein MVEN_01867200 [Mycena venus]|uniref:Uncharacterized protein n=1 Tax=Mycena venus TaxID=2733690 RepID=A0A8H6XIJ7_9AGAR|nr:hypothetical protein MVEN_01867200 [Mycena venus]